MIRFILLLISFFCLYSSLFAQITLIDSVNLKSDAVDMEIYQDTLLYVASRNAYNPGYAHARPDAGAINILNDTLVTIPGFAANDVYLVNSTSPSNLNLIDSMQISGNGDDFYYYDLNAQSEIAFRDLSEATGIAQDVSSAININGDFISVITNIPDGFRVISNTFQSGKVALSRGFYGIELTNNNIVYAGADDSSLVTFSLNTGVFTDTLTLSGIARGIIAVDTFLFCANGSNVASISIADPLHPYLLESVAVSGRVNDVVVSNNRLYVVSGSTDSSSVNAITIIEGSTGLTNLSVQHELFLDSPVWGIEFDPRDYDTFYAVTADSMLYTAALGIVNSIDKPNAELPEKAVLFENYPNPFNPTTAIHYQLLSFSNIQLSVYNLIGQKVKTLVSKQQSAGSYNIQWDGTNEAGEFVAGGVYLYRLQTDNFNQTRKMILLK